VYAYDRSGLRFEADLLANSVGQSFKLSAMLAKDADDFRHLRFDPCEPLVAHTLEFQVLPLQIRVSPRSFSLVGDKRRLVLDEHRQRFFEPGVAVL
jgi:hypothetical protein